MRVSTCCEPTLTTSGTTSSRGQIKDGLLEKKPASYADAMVATAGLLSILGLPLEVQGYWTEHSERSVLPTGLSLMEVLPQDKDLRGLRHLC